MWIDDSEFEGTLKHFPLRRDKHGARRSERPRGPPTHQQPSVRTKHLLRVPFLWAPLRVCTNPWPLICSAIILKAGEETVSVRNKEALTVNHSTARDGRAALQRLRGDRVAAFFIKRSVVVNQPSLSFRGKNLHERSVFVCFIIILGKDSRIFPLLTWRQNRVVLMKHLSVPCYSLLISLCSLDQESLRSQGFTCRSEKSLSLCDREMFLMSLIFNKTPVSNCCCEGKILHSYNSNSSQHSPDVFIVR